ncbi:MAG TPA: hypothetical protein VM103_02565 [Candidatus Paceibacterota bacterium]|nr:hypothetical protein [Candidatus Paceibacterota bacterium]
MSRSSLLILLGFLTILAPFAGLPSSWVAILTSLFGMCVAIIGFSIRVQKVEEARAQEKTAQAPVEDAPTPSIPHGVSPI